MSSMYAVRVIGVDEAGVSLGVTVVHPDASEVSDSPGLALMLLFDRATPRDPLGREFDLTTVMDGDWSRANARGYVARVVHEAGGALRIDTTHPGWHQHLRAGQSWDSAAFDPAWDYRPREAFAPRTDDGARSLDLDGPGFAPFPGWLFAGHHPLRDLPAVAWAPRFDGSAYAATGEVLRGVDLVTARLRPWLGRTVVLEGSGGDLQVGVMVQVSPSIGLTSVSDAGAGSSTWPYDEVRSVALAGYRPSPHARVAFTWPTSFRYANRIVTAAAIDGTRATLWIRTPTADAEPPVGSTAEALWVLAQPVLTWGEPGSDPAPLARSLRAERDRRGCDWRALAGGYLVDWSLTEPTEPAPDFDGANRDRADRITAGDWPTWRLELEVADPAWLAHLTGAPFPIERRSVPAAVPWEDPLLRWTEAPSATSTPTIASAEPEPPPMRTFAGPVTRGWAQLDPADPRTVIRDAGLRDDPAATRDLVQACKSGWVEVVRAYIALGANLDAAEPDTGTPPLVAAAEGDHPEVIRALVAGGAGLEVRDRSDDTAAMTAVNWHHPNALAALFALGADPSAANAYGQSSLTKVLEAPDPDLLAALLAAGADVNLGGERGQSALDKAAQSGDRALLRQLLDAGGDPGLTDAVGRPLLARVSDPELARLLLDAGAPIDGPPGGLAPIDAATIEGRDAVVALLASRGARAPDAVRIAAIRAVRDGDVAGVREALAAGADPNGPELERGSLLHRAVERGAQEVVDALLAAGADPNRLDEFGRPATAHCDDPAFGRWLCARGLAVNGTQSGWRTPLLGLALDKADAELLDAVIAAGAELRDLGWLHSPLVWGDYPDAWVVTVLERLAAAGADLEARYSIGEITLLCGFASRRRLAAVDALVALGADVEATNAQQQTALYLACGVGGSEEDAVAVLDRLVAAGARTDRVDWLRQSAYESAANYRRDGVRAWFEARFEATLGVGEPVWSEVAARTDDASFLHWVRTRRLDVVRGLLSAGYAPDPVQPTFESPLSVAATAGDLELVELLLAHGADPNWALPYDGRALTHATGAGQLEVVRALLAAGADLEARGFDHGPVYGVTDLALLELLLAAGASPEPRPAGWAPLHHAARVGAFEAADRLVAAGVHLDVRAPGRVTPLHLALDNDRIELGCALIAAGADPDVVALDGRTPLSIAVNKGSVRLVERLLAAGADPTRPDSSGRSIAEVAALRDELRPLFGGVEPALPPRRTRAWSPLFRAIYAGDWEAFAAAVVEADPALVNEAGDTPLIAAVAHGRTAMIQVLLDRGAPLDPTNRFGETAWAVGMATGQDLLALIEAAGAKVDMDGLNAMAGRSMRIGASHGAIMAGDLTAVEQRVDAGELDVDHLARGSRPLELAIDRGDRAMVRLLWRLGADPELPGRDGRSLRDRATAAGLDAALA